MLFRSVKVDIDSSQDISNIIMETIGESITKSKAYHIIDGFEEEKIISKRERDIIKAAIGDRAILNVEYNYRNKLRADILKNILLILAK